MQQTNIQILASLIGNSTLILEQQKTFLLGAVGSMDEKQLAELLTILSTESNVWEHITIKTIEQKAQEGDGVFFERLQILLSDGKKKLSKAHEKAEKGNEEQVLDTFFDQSA